MQKIWMALGAAAALASPLVSAQAETHGLVSSAKISPIGTITLEKASARALVPLAARAAGPVADHATYSFGLPFSDLNPVQVNDGAFTIPSGIPAKVMPAAKTASGFDGLDIYEQDTAGTGVYAGTQYSLEPPDQALAVGNGYVVEAINNALAIYKTDGKPAAVPVPMNEFLGLEPEYLYASQVYGSVSLSDPRAYYDAPSHRFFVEEWGTGTNPDGSATGTSAIYVAVSQTSDPTGAYTLYKFDTTFDPNDHFGPGDPILPDFVQIGADANGFYMSFNQFAYFKKNEPFVGPRILAVSKADMVAGNPTPIVSFSGGDLYNSNAGFTVYPAKTPQGGVYAAGAGGTEYFLSTVFASTANQLGIWAITNTASLNSAMPSLTLSDTLINSLPFAQPTPSIQKAGPIPLGTLVSSLEATPEVENRLDSGDTRMTQVTYVLGHLYSAIETSFPNLPSGTNSGFTYFSITPSLDSGGNVSGTVNHQVYASVPGETLSYPSLAINGTGGAVITCALIGPDFYPSAAYLALDSHLSANTVNISSLGVAPADGFTGYAFFGGHGVERWGDYSQAQPDEKGNMWLAQELISTKSSTLRSTYANFGTFITELKPTSTFGYK